MHYDVPWFKGATRFSLPQWLLTVMAQSGLYNDRRINQGRPAAGSHTLHSHHPPYHAPVSYTHLTLPTNREV